MVTKDLAIVAPGEEKDANFFYETISTGWKEVGSIMIKSTSQLEDGCGRAIEAFLHMIEAIVVKQME